VRPPPFRPRPFDDDPRYVRDQTTGLVWHRVAHRVLYADTDRSGVVYHANYFRYFELGRATLLRDAEFPYRAVEESGFVYPIFQLGLDFFKSLFYDDPMLVHSRFRELRGVRVGFDYAITHAETGDLICTGITRHCATNVRGVPVAVDPMTVAVYDKFNKLAG
jgi:acyl-CoA thioester hydrolase